MSEEEWLTIAQATHRDEDGKLLPVTEVVEFMEGRPKIRCVPMTKGELQKISSLGETGKEGEIVILKKYLIKPVLNDEALSLMSQKDILAIIWAIVSASTGMSQEMIRKNSMDAIAQGTEDWLKKKQT